MLFLRFRKTTPVSALAVGQAAIVEGKAVSDASIKVPGTDHDAVYHETVTEEFKAGIRQGRAMWTPVAGDEELTPFWLEDASGRVFVNPLGRSPRAPSEPAVKVSGGRSERGEGKRRGSRYITRYIAPGDVVRVRGLVAQPKPGKKGRVRPGLEIVGTDAAPMQILFRRRG